MMFNIYWQDDCLIIKKTAKSKHKTDDSSSVQSMSVIASTT